LAEYYEVHMGCFVDDEEDVKYFGNIKEHCKSFCARPLNPLLARLRSLMGFVTGQALTLPYYYDRLLAKWVERTLAENNISTIVAFSSPMGQYVIGPDYSRFRRIMDFVDIDSDKWQQYANKIRAPGKWIYSREARYLSTFEYTVTAEFDAAFFVSDNETKMFAREFPEFEDKLFTVRNGVDTAYFDPEISFESPYDEDAIPIVFTGVMDYWPNVDAVCWFAENILPDIREAVPTAQLWIVGTSPTKEVRDLTSISGVNVTGRVKDVRPYLKYATTAIAPLRIARGVQNKVLEAQAMGLPVVCTPQVAAGLTNASTAPLQLASSEGKFAEYVIAAALRKRYSTNGGGETRNYILTNYDWDQNLELVTALIQEREHAGSPTKSSDLQH